MPTNPTIESYDQYAREYDEETRDFWDRFPNEIIARFTNELEGTTVLALGSGPGREPLLLKSRGLTITCLDGSRAMVERTKALGFTSHHLHFSALETMPGRYHGVWAYTSLIHLPKQELPKALSSVHRLLLPQGIFAIGVIEGTGEGFEERASMPNTKRFFALYTSDELKKHVQAAGFSFIAEFTYTPNKKTYLTQVYRKD